MKFLRIVLAFLELLLAAISAVVVLAAAMNGALVVAFVSALPMLWLVCRPLKWVS